jgi:hypothetical protein
VTEPEFRRAVAEYHLVEPIAMADLEEIHRDLRPRVALGVGLDVVLRGDRVEVALRGARRVSAWIPVEPAG